MAAALPRGGDGDVRVARIHHDVGDAGAFAHGDERRPALATVGGLVQPAVAAVGPERPLRGDVDDVAVARVDEDAGDVLGLLETHPLPRPSRVVGAVHAIAVGYAALRVVLAGAHPDGARIPGVQHDGADGERGLPVEDRRQWRRHCRS